MFKCGKIAKQCGTALLLSGKKGGEAGGDRVLSCRHEADYPAFSTFLKKGTHHLYFSTRVLSCFGSKIQDTHPKYTFFPK